MSFKQVDAVIHYTKQVLADQFQPGVPVASYVTKEQRSDIALLVADSIITGETQMSDEARTKYQDQAKLLVYVHGMVKNWFAKSKELNGNVKHEYKNPGSRAGQGDAKLKELKALKANLVAAGNHEGAAKCDEFIAKRMAELKPATEAKAINPDLIPDELKDLIAG
jgi:hypothetical protein